MSLARGRHKYIKRTGSPGNYKYWYRDPSTGELTLGKEHGEARHKKLQHDAKNDHARRLIAAGMSKEHVQEHAGMSAARANEHISNMRQMAERRARRQGVDIDHLSREEKAKMGHDYHDNHIKEAITHHEHPDYHEITQRLHGKAERGRGRRGDAAGPTLKTRREREGRRAPRTTKKKASSRPHPTSVDLSPGDTDATHFARLDQLDQAESIIRRMPMSVRTRIGFDATAWDNLKRKAANGTLTPTQRTKLDTLLAVITSPAIASQATGTTSAQGLREASVARPVAKKKVAKKKTPEQSAAKRQAELLAKLKTDHGIDLTAPAAAASSGITKIEDGDEHERATAAGFNVGMSSAEKTEHLNGKAYGFRLKKQDNGSFDLTVVQNGNTVHESNHPDIKDAIATGGSVKTSILLSPNAARAAIYPPATAAQSSAPDTPEAANRARQAKKKKKARTLSSALASTGRAEVVSSAEAARRSTGAMTAADARSLAAHATHSGPAADASAARDLAEIEPAFAESEKPIRRMVEDQARGDNPYLNRAKEIYNRIKDDLKPERKQNAEYFMQAIDRVSNPSVEGGRFTDAALKQAYIDISGRRNFSGAKGDFEKSTFMTVDEISSNAPINLEVERMKRGFAAKQFARMKPFLNAAFTSANPSAPPPHPTYNDLKSWSEHGSARPASMGHTTPTGRAGGVTKAMPQEFYDSIPKDAGGKPQMPPAWMPLHLAPVWHYVVKKGGNPYQTMVPQVSQASRIDAGSQATYQEGVLMSSLRKYVQMRGGADQLVDIPSSKLAEVGLNHEKIFKARPHSSRDIKTLITTKIIDPVALTAFIRDDLAKTTKKSFALTVDEDQELFVRSRSHEANLRKSLIKQIRRLRDDKNTSFVSKLR